MTALIQEPYLVKIVLGGSFGTIFRKAFDLESHLTNNAFPKLMSVLTLK